MTSGEIRYVLRSLIRSRPFVLGSLATFSVGVGLNVAIFAVVDRVLFRPLPFPHAERLVTIHAHDPATGQIYANVSKRLVDEACQTAPAVEALAFAGNTRAFPLEGPERPPLRLTEASGNILDVLGVLPVAGRGFSPDDDRLEFRAVLLREETWRSRFAASVSAIGRRFDDGRELFRVVGILPAGFVNPSVNWGTPTDGLILRRDVLRPSAVRESVPAPVARLRRGRSLSDAQAQIAALASAVQETQPRSQATHLRVQDIRAGVFWNIQSRSKVLFYGGALVWLIACANLGTLMAARGKGREEQARIRLLLGATRARLAALSLLEAGVLCGTGSLVALLALSWTLRGLAAIVPAAAGTLTLAGVDLRVVSFTAIAAALGTVIATAYPLWEIGRLSGGSSQSPAGRGNSMKWLLVAESAIGIVLVMAGTLALRSFVGLVRTDLGFSPKGLYRVHVGVRMAPEATASVESFRQALAAIGAGREIVAASAVDVAVGSGEAGQVVTDDEGRRFVARQVFPSYFEVMRTPVLAGRVFSESEMRAGAPLAVVSASAARLLAPETDVNGAVGRLLMLEGGSGRRVVGVVADTRERHGSPAGTEVIVPANGDLPWIPTFLLRTASSQPPDIGRLRETLRRHFGADTTVTVSSVARRLAPWLQEPRFYAYAFGAFAAVAIVLSAAGLFALSSYEASLRLKEVGIRLALGATRVQIQSTCLLRALSPVAAGVTIGAVAAYWWARTFQELLHGVDARDVKVYGFVALFYLLLVSFAAWHPARRAGNTDPLTTLRTE